MKRAFGYLRVSLDPHGDSLSPQQQRAEIERAAHRRNHHIADWFEDRDRSAYQRNIRRPAFDQMLERLHEVDAIWVYELSRQNRRALRSLGLYDQLEQAGKVLYSVTQGDSETGRLPFGIYALMDEEESRRTSRRVTRAFTYIAHELGRPVSPHRSYGFSYTKGAGVLEIVTHEAAVIRRMAAWYLDGHGAADIARAANDGRLMGTPVAPLRATEWSQGTVSRLLRSPTIAGYITYRGEIVGVEPTQSAILDVDTWTRVQAVRATRSNVSRRPRRAEGELLYGIARCASCGGPLVASGRPQWRTYRCSRGLSEGKRCADPVTMPLRWLDAYVSGWFLDWADLARIGRDAQDYRQNRTDTHGETRREVVALEGAVDRLIDAYALHGRMIREAYADRLAELEGRLTVLREKLESDGHARVLQDLRTLPDMRAAWPVMRVQARREILTAFLEPVMVSRRPKGAVPSSRWVNVQARGGL